MKKQALDDYFKSLPLPREKIAGLVFKEDHAVAFSEDILLNQLRRDCITIGESFDKICGDDLQTLSRVQSRAISILHQGLHVKGQETLFAKTGALLMNANSSFIAAVHLLRSGFVLQPGILIRSIIEQVASVLHLIQTPTDLKNLDDGTFNSTKTIKGAKNILPIFGIMYGYFSDEFAHIGKLHVSTQPVTHYKSRSEPLLSNLQALGAALLLIDTATELLFFELVPKKHYWESRGPGRYVFNPKPAGKAFMNFIGVPEPEEPEGKRNKLE